MTDPEQVRRRVEAARAYADISNQATLADLIEMDRTKFKRRLSGKPYTFSRGDLIAIAAVCGVPRWFLERGFGATLEDADADPLAAPGEERVEDVIAAAQALPQNPETAPQEAHERETQEEGG